MSQVPILYSFRRCPYAMRARLAISSAGVGVELREILLRAKAPEFLATSPKATVPVLVLGDKIIEESLDIMLWALEQSDPEALLPQDVPAAIARIEHLETHFKPHLDRTKYGNRYPDEDPETHRAIAHAYLDKLEDELTPNLGGAKLTLCDLAILPFVRQFAFIDKARFDAQAWPNIHRWLENFLASERLAAIMAKNETWKAGDPPLAFP